MGTSVDWPIGRVTVEHRTQYRLLTDNSELAAEPSGRLRHSAACGIPPGLPAVGDWVEYQILPGESRAVIHALRPRTSLFLRKEPGRAISAQILAANVSVAFLVSALPDGVNPRRLERFLTLAIDGGIRPVFVLNKSDLVEDSAPYCSLLEDVARDVPIHIVSAQTGAGFADLVSYFDNMSTIVCLGASGAGKSSIINRLLGRNELPVGDIRDDGRGRHTTTTRQLLTRPAGGAIIDTPGIRELAWWEGGDGVETAFAEVEDLAGHCRFRDCSHQSEPGCAVRAAIENGLLPADRLESFQKLRKEIAHLDRRSSNHAQAERKRLDKEMHRALYRRLDQKKQSQ